MYIVLEKSTNKTLHINPAPLDQALTDREVFAAFDPASMQIARTEASVVPEHFRVLADGTLAELSRAERIERGLEKLAPEEKLVNGEVVRKSLGELALQGLIPFDEKTQKVDGERVVAKSEQELLASGALSYDEMRARHLRRLRAEAAATFESTTTTSGYFLDALARQKAAASLPYRRLPADDAGKAELLRRKLIYPDAITDEILERTEEIQNAYSRAKAAIENAYEQKSLVSEFEVVKLKNFLAR